ncbi:MAG: hypothetical protein JXI33_06030 [Candidatus Aminicenantes bacterium]|nr:hypothetical protein [Candidatus Aminicenantes bacterium]
MNKRIIRILLLAAAMIFTINLLLFSYGPWLFSPLLGAVFFLGAIISIGFFVAWKTRIKATGILEAAALGLMATTAYFYLLAFFKIINPFTIGIFFAAAILPLPFMLLNENWRGENLAGLKRFFSRPLAEFALFIFPLFYAALPPSFYDSLVYHLGIPNLYLQSGGFIATPQFVFANTFIYYEISLIPAVFIGTGVPRLFHFLLGALFILTVADEAVENWGIQGRLNLLLLIASLPMTLFLLVTCKNDLSGAIFIFLAIVHYRRQNLKLSALFWGFAAGIKYFNLLPLALFLLLVIKPWKKADLKKIALMAMIIFLVVSPLLLKNFHYSGNPFFPFLQKVFPAAQWDSERQSRLQAEVGRIVHTPADFVKLPYNLSFFAYGYGGLVGPFFLIFLPLLLLRPFSQKKWLLWALLLLAIAPFFTGSIRFAYAAFIMLAVFSLQGYEAAGGRILKTIFYLLITVNFVMGFALLEKFYLGHYMLSGKFSGRQYIEHFFPTYPVFAYINANAPPRAGILVAGEARNYYLKRPYQVSSAMDYCILKKYLKESRTSREFTAAIKKAGFSYLLVNMSELQRLQKHYATISDAEQETLIYFLRPLRPIFRSGSTRLYKISDS